MVSSPSAHSASIPRGAYIFLTMMISGLAILITASSLRIPTAQEFARQPFYLLFGLHDILFVFLLGWWLLTRRPPIGEFLSIPRQGNGDAVLTGFAVGVGGWIFTISVALVIGLILTASGAMPKHPQISPMIAWMVALPIWKKVVIV